MNRFKNFIRRYKNLRREKGTLFYDLSGHSLHIWDGTEWKKQ